MKHLLLVLTVAFLVFVPLYNTQSQAETLAFIPSYGDNTITRVDTNENVFTIVDIRQDSLGAYGAALSLNNRYLYVTCMDSDEVLAIAVDDFETTGAQVAISVGEEPRGVAVEPSGMYAYVANYTSNSVSRILVSTTSTIEIEDVGNGPLGVAAYHDDNATEMVYVTNFDDDSVAVIIDDKVDTTITDVGDGPAGLALTPAGDYLYVANTGDDTVAVIDTEDQTIITTINVGDYPWGVAVGAEGQYVYVTNSEDDTVTVIRTSNNTIYATYNVGNQPMGVAAPANGNFAYVINQLGNSISKIDIDAATVQTIGSGQINGAYALGAFIGGTQPDRPTGLSATTESDSRIALTWTDNSSDELGFKIERRKESDDTYTQITKVDADTTTYTDFGLEGATTYYYRIRAYNEAADSDYATAANATTKDMQFSWCFINALH